MNKATALFAAAAVIFATTSAYLARTLQAERARHPAVTSAQPVVPDVTAGPLEAAVPTVVPQDAPPDPAALTASTNASMTPVKLPSRVRNRTHGAAMLAYFRLLVEKEYPDLASALGLMPDEAEGFIDLLAQQKARDAEDLRTRRAAKQGEGKDLRQQREQRLQVDRAEQAAFLGDARAAEWNRYLESLGSRAEVRELRMQLADSDYPLRREQYQSLVDVLADEEIRHRGDRQQLLRSGRDPSNPTPAETIEHFDKRLTLIEESLARRARAAASVLDSEQLRRYQAMLDQERLRAQVEYDSFVTLNAEAARKSE